MCLLKLDWPFGRLRKVHLQKEQKKAISNMLVGPSFFNRDKVENTGDKGKKGERERGKEGERERGREGERG